MPTHTHEALAALQALFAAYWLLDHDGGDEQFSTHTALPKQSCHGKGDPPRRRRVRRAGTSAPSLEPNSTKDDIEAQEAQGAQGAHTCHRLASIKPHAEEAKRLLANALRRMDAEARASFFVEEVMSLLDCQKGLLHPAAQRITFLRSRHDTRAVVIFFNVLQQRYFALAELVVCLTSPVEPRGHHHRGRGQASVPQLMRASFSAAFLEFLRATGVTSDLLSAAWDVLESSLSAGAPLGLPSVETIVAPLISEGMLATAEPLFAARASMHQRQHQHLHSSVAGQLPSVDGALTGDFMRLHLERLERSFHLPSLFSSSFEVDGHEASGCNSGGGGGGAPTIALAEFEQLARRIATLFHLEQVLFSAAEAATARARREHMGNETSVQGRRRRAAPGAANSSTARPADPSPVEGKADGALAARRVRLLESVIKRWLSCGPFSAVGFLERGEDEHFISLWSSCSAAVKRRVFMSETSGHVFRAARRQAAEATALVRAPATATEDLALPSFLAFLLNSPPASPPLERATTSPRSTESGRSWVDGTWNQQQSQVDDALALAVVGGLVNVAARFDAIVIRAGNASGLFKEKLHRGIRAAFAQEPVRGKSTLETCQFSSDLVQRVTSLVLIFCDYLAVASPMLISAISLKPEISLLGEEWPATVARLLSGILEHIPFNGNAFAHAYRVRLTKRLLLGNPRNLPLEHLLVRALANSSTGQSAERLFKMLKLQLNDITEAMGAGDALGAAVVDAAASRAAGCVPAWTGAFSLSVFTLGHWPPLQQRAPLLEPPPPFAQLMSAAVAHLHERAPTKILTWVHNLGVADLRVAFPQGTKEIVVNTIQASILMAIDAAPSRSIELADLCRALVIHPGEVVEQLRGLASVTQRSIITAHRSQVQACSGAAQEVTRLALNLDFSARPRRLRFTNMKAMGADLSSPQPESQQHARAGEAAAADAHQKAQVDAAIVRTLKSRLHLPCRELFSTLLAMLRSTVTGLTIGFMMARVASLERRGFLRFTKTADSADGGSVVWVNME